MSDITLDSNYAQYLQSINSASADKLKSTAGKDLSKADDEELMEACKEFEAYFLEMVMKEMTKGINFAGENADSGNSTLVDFYKDKTISSLAEQTTESSPLGLAQQMYEQMKRTSQAPSADEILAMRAQAQKETSKE